MRQQTAWDKDIDNVQAHSQRRAIPDIWISDLFMKYSGIVSTCYIVLLDAGGATSLPQPNMRMTSAVLEPTNGLMKWGRGTLLLRQISS